MRKDNKLLQRIKNNDIHFGKKSYISESIWVGSIFGLAFLYVALFIIASFGA